MKKLLTLCLLVATSFAVKAQEMSFEETVKYINEKIACCGEQKINPISCNLNGDITWHYVSDKRINLFDLLPATPDGSTITILNSDGILVHNSIGYSWIDFQISADKTVGFSWYAVQADAERVYKALLHLKSLCTKKKDPFD